MDNLMDDFDEKLPSIKGNVTFSPVNVKMYNTLGIFILGVLSIVLLVSLLKSQKRCQELMEKTR